jgi:outer membrane receptor protein involved in Fe transport
MEEKMQKRIAVFFSVLLLVPALMFAGITGKIRGKVTDRETKEALIGANVTVEGTSLGAKTDIEGEFIILNVPAGTYSLKASYVGYSSTTISNIRVSTDLTTSQNLALAPEAIQVTGVEIIAERPLVNKNATNAVRVVAGEDLQNIPVRGIASVVALQPGVVAQGGEVFIRGGRQDEVGYYVDGADARDARDGKVALTVIPEAVEEFQVQAGGYNAEYGGANAGIVRQQLKTGTSNFTASLRVESDAFVNRGENFLGGYSYGHTEYAGTVSGPLFADNIKFFAAGNRVFDSDPTAAFWNGFTFNDLVEDLATTNNTNNPIVTDPNSPYFGRRTPDSLDLVILPGNVPGRGFQSWGANGTLTFDLNPIIFRLSGTFNRSKNIQNLVPIRYILNNARLRREDGSTGLYSAKLTHFLQPQTYYDLTFSYFDQRFKRYDPNFGDDYLSYGDSIANYAKGFQYFKRTQSPLNLVASGFRFTRYGALMGGYLKRKANYFSGQFDLTHQLTHHELKGGFSYREHRIRNYGIGGGDRSVTLEALYNALLAQPDAARNGGDTRDLLFRSNAFPNNYGYDVYGNEIEGTGIDGVKKPKYISAYIQDKFEFEDLVINAGLRFDSFDNDDFTFDDPKNPPYNNAAFTVSDSGTTKYPTFKAVSPRLGFSFPVTDKTVFHVQYGQFVQAPVLNDIYVSRAQMALFFSGRNFIANPFGAGLDPVRTTQYEIGFSQQFSDFASFDLTTFYKDIKGQIQYESVTTTSGSATASYNILRNGDYATTKGLELAVRLRRTNRVQGAINYTLSDAQGTGSSRNSTISSVQSGPERPTVISPLQFNQTHRGTVNLDYRFGKDDGGPILERLGANLLLTFNSGHAYTKALQASTPGQRNIDEAGILADDDPRSRKPDGSINASTTPWVFQIDLRLDKTVSIGGLFDMNFYMYVANLLDTKNVFNVYSRSGNAEDDGFLSNPAISGTVVAQQGPRYVELYNAINNGNRQHYWDNQLDVNNAFGGGDIYGPPRQIRFGVNITY